MTGLEKLLQRKLPADVFKAVKEALDPEDLDYVPRSRLDDVIDERDTAREEARKLKKNAGNAGDLQGKLDALQTKYDTDIAAKDAEIKGIHRTYKIDGALRDKGAKNVTAVRALLNEEALKEDLSGLDEEIKRITESDPYLFTTKRGKEGKGGSYFQGGTGKEHMGTGEGDQGGSDGVSKEFEAQMVQAVFGGGI